MTTLLELLSNYVLVPCLGMVAGAFLWMGGASIIAFPIGVGITGIAWSITDYIVP